MLKFCNGSKFDISFQSKNVHVISLSAKTSIPDKSVIPLLASLNDVPPGCSTIFSISDVVIVVLLSSPVAVFANSSIALFRFSSLNVLLISISAEYTLVFIPYIQNIVQIAAMIIYIFFSIVPAFKFFCIQKDPFYILYLLKIYKTGLFMSIFVT